MIAQLRIVVLLMPLLAACGGSSAVPAAVVCEVEHSTSACFRCQAQRCGPQLDRCYGNGFHEGRAVGTTTARCLWNPDTQEYDRNCTFSGGARSEAGVPDVPCGNLATCLQSCGCGSDCKATCFGAGRSTTYFANDPRVYSRACASCETDYLAACVKASCAAECAPADAGTD